MTFERITIEPAKIGGQPCIRGLHMPVATVVAMVADGMTAEEILEGFPYLERQDIAAALDFVARSRADDAWGNLDQWTETNTGRNLAALAAEEDQRW